MWKDKRTGNWQTRVGRNQVSLMTSNSTLAKERESKVKSEYIDLGFGIRRSKPILVSDLVPLYVKSRKDKRGNPKAFQKKIKELGYILDGRILPVFGNVIVQTLTTEKIQKWVDELEEEGLKADSINRYVTILRAIVRWGKQQSKLGILFDPVGKWPRCKVRGKQMAYLTAEEVQSVLLSEHPAVLKIKNILKTALLTGLRLSNVVLLRWVQIDEPNGYIIISGAEMKDDSDDDFILPILPELQLILEAQKGLHDEFVFIAAHGEPWVPRSVSCAWKAARHALGIRRNVRFHDLRHTFASHLAMQGFSLDEIREFLGQKSTQMTKRYAHLSPAYKKKRIAGFGYNT